MRAFGESNMIPTRAAEGRLASCAKRRKEGEATRYMQPRGMTDLSRAASESYGKLRIDAQCYPNVGARAIGQNRQAKIKARRKDVPMTTREKFQR